MGPLKLVMAFVKLNSFQNKLGNKLLSSTPCPPSPALDLTLVQRQANSHSHGLEDVNVKPQVALRMLARNHKL